MLPFTEPTHCPAVAAATELIPPPVLAGEQAPADGGEANAPTKEFTHW